MTFLITFHEGHAELTPFCHQGKDIGTVSCIVHIFTIGDCIAYAAFAFVHSYRIKDTDSGTIFQQFIDDYQGWGFAHVIGLGFEGQANDGNGFAF